MIPVRRSILEQTAKKIKKLKGLKWSKALDEAALELGFNNYRHFLNAYEKSKPGKQLKQDFSQFISFPVFLAFLKKAESVDVAKACTKLGLDNDVKNYLLSIFEERGLSLVGLIPNSMQRLEFEFDEFNFRPIDEHLSITGDFSIQVKSLFKEDPKRKSAVKRSDRFQGNFSAQIDSSNSLILQEVSINDKAFWA
ncbi:MAG: hypothetical protein WC635_04215 [Bacteriovorax sp.]|jgi:hypothetical protein